MLWTRKLDSYEDNSPRKKLSLFIDRTFQLKYGMFILASSLTGMAVAVLPVHFFLRQNYGIFLDLAYSYAPSLNTLKGSRFGSRASSLRAFRAWWCSFLY